MGESWQALRAGMHISPSERGFSSRGKLTPRWQTQFTEAWHCAFHWIRVHGGRGWGRGSGAGKVGEGEEWLEGVEGWGPMHECLPEWIRRISSSSKSFWGGLSVLSPDQHWSRPCGSHCCLVSSLWPQLALVSKPNHPKRSPLPSSVVPSRLFSVFFYSPFSLTSFSLFSLLSIVS